MTRIRDKDDPQAMSFGNQPHKYRCETCSFNKETADCGCPAWQFNKFLVPIIGCASHSSATKAEQRITDVIADLERLIKETENDAVRFRDLFAVTKIEGYKEALALLRGKGE